MPPLQTRPKAALVGVGRHVILRPAVQKRYVELVESTLEDQQSDLERLLAAMDDVELRVPLGIVRELGGTLRRADWKVTAVVVDDVLIDVEEGDTSASRHAIAFDLGTTTVVATLLDLETGLPKAVRSVLNAQQPFGADVISRISAIMMEDDALERLQRHAHETLQQLTDEVCAEADVDPAEVYEIVVAGNQTMIQIALGIDPEPLSMAPFTVVARHMTGRRRRLRRFGVTVHRRAPPSSPPRSAPTSGLTSSPASSRQASRSTAACGSSSTSARTPRSCSAPPRKRSRPRRPPGRRSRRRRSAVACAPPTAPSRA